MFTRRQVGRAAQVMREVAAAQLVDSAYRHLPIGTLWTALTTIDVRQRPSSFGLQASSHEVRPGSTILVLRTGHLAGRPDWQWTQVLSDGHVGFLNMTHFTSGSIART